MSHFMFSDRSNGSLTIAIAEQPLVNLLVLRALFDMGASCSLTVVGSALTRITL